MTAILHIDSSITGPHSSSRALSAEIVARQRALLPGASVVYRDLAAAAPPHLTGPLFAALQASTANGPGPGAALSPAGTYIDELFAAEIIVIGAPMYNFSVPSQLKGWIDQVCIAGRTFRYDANGVEGLLKGKKLFIASSRGGFYTGDSPMAFLDHHEAYLTGVLGFIGLTDATVIRAEGINLGDAAKATAMAKASAEIAALTA